MTGSVVPLRGRETDHGLQVLPRLEGLLAILQAIDAGDMLAALPACDLACQLHQAAVRLLGLTERELADLCADLRETASGGRLG
jgi:hypothetical protein